MARRPLWISRKKREAGSSGVEAGGIFEKVHLAGTVGIRTGRGERVVEAEVLELPRVRKPVAGIAAEVIRDGILHVELEGGDLSGVAVGER